jgi:hypothetical protein
MPSFASNGTTSWRCVSRAALGQPLQPLPFVLDDFRPRQFLLLLLDECDDRFTPGFDQVAPGHLFDIMHRSAPFGRKLDLVQHLGKQRCHLAKPLLNLDNHHSCSRGRKMKH